MTHLLCHWDKYHTKKNLRPISHEEKTHLGKICVIMTDLMAIFDEKLSWVMLYVKNGPSQAVKQVKQISKQNNPY